MSQRLSIVIPCLNEAVSLPKLLEEISSVFPEAEIIIADNGSTDDTFAIGNKYAATVVVVQERGYGAAVRGGLAKAKGDILCYMDGDGSYDPRELLSLLSVLESGYDLVFGNRLTGTIEKGAMPFLHRYVGTPILNIFLSCVLRKWIGDVNSGQRCFTRGLYQRMHLTATGMEFASQFFLEAQLAHARMASRPILYRKDFRQGPSHLVPLRDGVRHLRCIVTYLFRRKG